MGIFPKFCEACSSYFVPCNSQKHCEQLEADIRSNEQRMINDQVLLRTIIEALKLRGEATSEILDAAYQYGYSVSRTEPKWLDEELQKMKEKNKCV